MSLLVVGASGFLGRNLLVSLPPGADVTAVYNQALDFPQFLRERGLAHVRAVRADLTCPEQIDAIAGTASFFEDCVYLAANGDPAVSVTRPGFDLRSNCLTLVNLLDAVSVGSLVFVSSGAVYDGLKGPVSPESPVRPRLPYAISKLAAEHYLRQFQERGRVRRAVAVRFFGAFGPYEPPRKIYSRLVRQFGILRDPRFTIRGDGKNLIDAMYVTDAVRALRLLLASAPTSLTVDLCSGLPITLTELVRRAAAVFGLQADIAHEGAVPEYIEFQSADRTMAQRFGFAPSVSLEAGLQELHAHLAAPA